MHSNALWLGGFAGILCPPIYYGPVVLPGRRRPEVFVVALHPLPRSHVAFRAAAVTKVFGDTIALWDVNIECGSGGLLAIHGANGSGKTTLLRIVAGLAAPTRGRIAWTSDSPGTRPRIGLLGHASHLFDELTAIENVALAARLARRDEASAIDLLSRLGVEQYGARRASDLSAGTRRRVGLARVLATDPDVLLIDEPFAGLDQLAADLVGRNLAEGRDDGRVVVIATHDDARSRFIATTTAWLEAGRLRPKSRPQKPPTVCIVDRTIRHDPCRADLRPPPAAFRQRAEPAR